MFVTECKRCRAGGTGAAVPDLRALLAEIRNLDDTDRVTLRRWMEGGRRQPLDRLWSGIRRLPSAARNELRKQLAHKQHGPE